MNLLMKNIFFGLEFELDPVAFTIPKLNWSIYWYGIIITVGFALAVIYALRRSISFGINPDRLIDCVIVVAPCSIIGARLYYIAFDPTTTIRDFFKIHEGGMAILGAVIAAVLSGWLMCWLRRVNFAAALDLTALGFLLGQGIGRWGNFVNQEAYGTLTGSTWFGISGDGIIRQTGISESFSLFHPCFLYESIWCLAGFVLLHFLSKKRAFAGETACQYLVWYGLGRMVIEGLRTDSLMIGEFIRVSQLLSALMAVVGIMLIVVFRRAAKINEKAPVYSAVFDEIEETEFVKTHTEDSQIIEENPTEDLPTDAAENSAEEE